MSSKIADIGAGSCSIAQYLEKTIKLKISSFDLGRSKENENYVTIANMITLPLEAESQDVVIYSLSLMGTDLKSILLEAARVTK